MSKIFFLLLVSFPMLLSGQETKKVTRKMAYQGLKEIFYVLKSDTSVRHGSYVLNYNGKILIRGHYQMGIKDSIWTQYNIVGQIRSSGWIENNKRDRIWEFFNNKGELEQKIDFSIKEVLYYHTTFAHHPFMIFTGSDTIVSILDRPPLYVGGASRFNEFMADELRIPLHKPGEKVRGTVYVQFTIDSTGATSEHRTLKGIGVACDGEAVRALKSIDDDWLPGILNGRPVCVQYIVPVIFDEYIRPADLP